MGSNWLVDSNGKYTVLFNGVNIPCVYGNDTVCPSSAQCFQNLKWSAVPSQCVCNFWFGKTGDMCDDLIPDGAILAVVGSLSIVVNVFSLCFGLYDLFRLYRARATKDSVRWLLYLVVLQAICEILLAGNWVLRLFNNNWTYVVDNGEVTTRKASIYRAYGTAALPPAFFFSTLTLLHVSLSWISIVVNIAKAGNAGNREASTATLRHRAALYHRMLIVYYAIALGSIIYSMIVDLLTIVTIVIILAGIFIIFTYGYGSYRVSQLLAAIRRIPRAGKLESSHSGNALNTGGSTSETNSTSNNLTVTTNPAGTVPLEQTFVYRTLRSVMITSATIAAITGIAVSLAATFVALGGELQANNPERATASVVMYFFVLTVSISCFVVALYAHAIVQNALKRIQEQQLMHNNVYDLQFPQIDEEILLATTLVGGGPPRVHMHDETNTQITSNVTRYQPTLSAVTSQQNDG